MFSRAGGQGLLPSSLPLRSCWQEAGRSADSHGEGISKAKGSFLSLLQEKTRCFPLVLSSCNPSPRPHIAHGRSWHSLGVPHHPQAQRGEKPALRRALAHLPLPLNPPDLPAASNRCPRPLVPAPATVRTRGCHGDAQRTTRRSSCSARPARWCRASRCLFWTFSKCCSSSV